MFLPEYGRDVLLSHPIKEKLLTQSRKKLLTQSEKKLLDIHKKANCFGPVTSLKNASNSSGVSTSGLVTGSLTWGTLL